MTNRILGDDKQKAIVDIKHKEIQEKHKGTTK